MNATFLNYLHLKCRIGAYKMNAKNKLMNVYAGVVLIAIMLLFSGCSADEDFLTNQNISYERVPIAEVVMPDQLIKDQNTEIIISYYKPSDCYSFSGFEDNLVTNEYTISVINVIENSSNCIDLQDTELISQKFNFIVGSENSYVFRFWQGNNQFLTLEVPVTDGTID